jgi:hypothetical protein
MGGGGGYLTQRLATSGGWPVALLEVLDWCSFAVLGMSGGCMLSIFTYGRLMPKPPDNGQTQIESSQQPASRS